MLVTAGLAVIPPALAQEKDKREYEILYSGQFKPAEGFFAARIEVSQDVPLLRLLDFAAAEAKYYHFAGDGEVRREGDRVLWTIPPEGGTLNYEVRVDHRRGSTLDARLTDRWSLVRLDDLFPPARARSRIRSEARATLAFDGPDGWLFETQYGAVDDPVAVDNPRRSFDRPTGWLAAGKLGIRREMIADRKVAIAAPIDQGLRRMDILAFLGWVLPDLTEVFPGFPDRLLVTGARDGMWRGALSGPSSLYLHTDRPLLSENGTSTLLHELVHVATRFNGGPRDDWLVEGLAEYYSLEILRRSGGITRERFDDSMDELEAWARSGKGKLRSPSTGPHTARAVIVLLNLQKELRDKKAGRLDAIVRELVEGGVLTGSRLLELTETALGGPSESLRPYLENEPSPGASKDG